MWLALINDRNAVCDVDKNWLISAISCGQTVNVVFINMCKIGIIPFPSIKNVISSSSSSSFYVGMYVFWQRHLNIDALVNVCVCAVFYRWLASYWSVSVFVLNIQFDLFWPLSSISTICVNTIRLFTNACIKIALLFEESLSILFVTKYQYRYIDRQHQTSFKTMPPIRNMILDLRLISW